MIKSQNDLFCLLFPKLFVKLFFSDNLIFGNKSKFINNLEKTDKSFKASDQLKLLKRIAVFVKPFIGLLIVAILFNIIFSFFTAISITVIKPIIEIITGSNLTSGAETVTAANPLEALKNYFFQFVRNIILNPDDMYSTIINLCFFILVIFLLKNLFKYISSIASVKLEEGVIKHIRDELFKKITSLSLEFFVKKQSGNVMSVLTNDVAVLNSSTVAVFNGFLRESIQVILLLILLLSVSTELTLIAFSTSVISLILIRIGMKYLRRYASRMQTAMADYTTVLQESLSGIRIIKGYNAENIINEKFSGQTSKYVRSAVKYNKIISLIPSINEIFAILALSVVFFVGGSKVVSGEMPGDELMLFLASLFAIMSPVTTILHSISQFQRGAVATERVFDILDYPLNIISGSKSIKEFKNEIFFDNINFSYDTVPVLEGVELKIKKGSKIAIVGQSGSGKSTLLDLLVRFYDPTFGKILIDGIDIKELKIEDYRALFGIVSQETILFNDTIANNITFGLKNVSDDKIIEAAKISNSYDFIMKLPDTFNTKIGDRGIMLSGGERQRIAIARALLRDPYILVFDEATSSLDAESEKVVQEAINQSMKLRTAVIVAHRLSTIMDCDTIYVLDNGRIIEKGSHIELLNLNGIYKKLYEIQFGR